MARLSLLLAFGCLAAITTATIPACGDDGSCPGTLCTDCSASGDCPSLDCGGGQSLFCVAFPFGGQSSGQRCTFCEDPDFQLP